jgi:hypothetical protein
MKSMIKVLIKHNEIGESSDLKGASCREQDGNNEAKLSKDLTRVL